MATRAQATAKKATSVSEWKKDSYNPFQELPSGKTIKIKKAVGFQTLMKSGLIPNSLMSIVQKSLDKGEEPDVSTISSDMGKINEMLELMDNITCFMVEEPEIHPVPKNKEDRDGDLLYVDEVEDQDKMFIFQYATGGTKDLETFRREAGSVLDTVQRGSNVGRKAQPARRR